MNHIHPYIKLTNKQSSSIECGSETSNWISKNKAAEANQPFTLREFGYPYESDQCYGTFGQGKFRTDPLPDKDGTSISYHKPERFVSTARGFLHEYDDSGFVKIAALDMSNKHFFRQMFIDEIVATNWF